jgi:hypothetical protein
VSVCRVAPAGSGARRTRQAKPNTGRRWAGVTKTSDHIHPDLLPTSHDSGSIDRRGAPFGSDGRRLVINGGPRRPGYVGPSDAAAGDAIGKPDSASMQGGNHLRPIVWRRPSRRVWNKDSSPWPPFSYCSLTRPEAETVLIRMIVSITEYRNASPVLGNGWLRRQS